MRAFNEKRVSGSCVPAPRLRYAIELIYQVIRSKRAERRERESFQLSSSSFQASNATFDVVERVFWQKDFYVEHKKGERKINRIEQKHRAREKSLK